MTRTSSPMGGGAMLRAVSRALGAGVGAAKEQFAGAGRPGGGSRSVWVSSSPPQPPSSSYSSFWARSPPREDGRAPCPCLYDDWEAIDDWEDALRSTEHHVFGPSPSREEAEGAVAALQQVFGPVSSSQNIEDGCSFTGYGVADNMKVSTDTVLRSSSVPAISDWIEPSADLLSYKEPCSPEYGRVLDAFHLLKIDQSMQRMVISLSSDKTVWDAVMRNEVVQEIRKSLFEEEGSNSEDRSSAGILKWAYNNAKEKMVEFLKQINKIADNFFHGKEKREADMFDTLLRSSFMLSVMVFMVVVVARAQKP